MSSPTLRAAQYAIKMDRPLVMGIVNVTPDSFSDGGKFFATDAAIAQARQLVDDGADILDLGGESTRPGAAPASLEEELARVMPVLEAAVNWGVPVSVDTQKPVVMREAIAAGAAMINDVNALQADGAVEICAASSVAVCLMHKRGSPATMQENPVYDNVVAEVREFLLQRADACRTHGIPRERIVLDVGFGFGKTTDHNFSLLRELAVFADAGYPLLAGLSRKRSLGNLTGRDVDQRLAASLAAALIAVQNGAHIVRVHDVKETVDALKVWAAVRGERSHLSG
jgi:dihydropteroate synthase